jgi:hypothetical protein
VRVVDDDEDRLAAGARVPRPTRHRSCNERLLLAIERS